MICIKCSAEFPNWVEIDGKKRNLKSRHYCLTCSPFGSHNTKKHIDAPSSTGYSAEGHGGYKHVKARRRRIKERAVKHCGGACVLCGYDRCLEALEFHHLDPTHKDFNLSHAASRSWPSIQSELDKCALLCSNCHREVHAGFTQLS